MKWITQISLANYRAFAEQKEITLKPGEHLLIYGENGSGKSSLYHALYDFFVSSPLTAAGVFQYKRNEFLSPAEIGAVIVTVSDDAGAGVPQAYSLDKDVPSSTNRETFLRIANAYKGFLDYRRMLRLHALQTPDGQAPNVFNVLLNDLLGDYQIADPYGGADYLPMSEAYGKLKTNLTRKGRKTTSTSFTTEAGLLAAFSTNFIAQLDAIFPEAQRLLQTYFKANISISHDTKEIKLLTGKRMQEVAELKVNYAGHTAQSYQYFLNEARLSAIALSIHLGALKVTGGSASPGTLRVLYLDDVFIGLDTSNRLPLLDILDKEFINPKKANGDPDEPTQIIISTHDRQWYETARSWLEALKIKVHTVEMFVGKPLVIGGPEKPVIVPIGLNHAEKAQAYFDAHDYPAAANAIRKACEAELKRILPQNEKLQAEQKGTIKEIREADELFTKFEAFAVATGIPTAPFVLFRTYKKILLNPFSHDDATAPHFRTEVEAGLNIIAEFKKILTKHYYFADHLATHPFTLDLPNAVTGVVKTYQITALEDLIAIRVGAAPGFVKQVMCNVQGLGGPAPYGSFNAAYDAIWADSGNAAPTDYITCRANTNITNTKTMASIANLT